MGKYRPSLLSVLPSTVDMADLHRPEILLGIHTCENMRGLVSFFIPVI